MKYKSVTGVVVAAVVAASVLLVPSAATAAQASFTNPLADPDPANFAVTRIDATYTDAALTVVAHTRNSIGPGFTAYLYALDGPFTPGVSGKGYIVVGDSADGTTVELNAVNYDGPGNTVASTEGVTIARDAESGTVTFTIPTARIFFAGPVYLIGQLADGSNQSEYFAQNVSSFPATGLGPIVKGPSPTTTAVTLTSTSQVYASTPGALVARITPATAAGTIQIVEGSTILTSAPVTGGVAVLNVPVNLSTGVHTFTARFVPADPVALSISDSAPISFTVISAAKATKTTVTLSKKTQTYKKSPAKLAVSVEGKPAGSVAIYDGAKLVKTLALKNGKASYTLPKTLKKGTHSIKAVYITPNIEAYQASTSNTVKLKVKK